MNAVVAPLTAVGVIRNGRTNRESTPVQSALNLSERGTVEIFEPYVDGLTGLEEFDHVWLLCWLGERDSPPRQRPAMTQVPFLLQREQRQLGIFATRGPRRINPIGLSLVRLVDVTDATITFDGVDMIDGTLVLDIKPYVTRFDRPDGEPRCGWFDTVDMPNGATPEDLAD